VRIGKEEVEYLYCERCAKVTTVPPARLEPVRRRIRELFGYTARFGHFPIVGVCDDCARHRSKGSS
jgi:Fur family ferric uptake transcriptional regulator